MFLFSSGLSEGGGVPLHALHALHAKFLFHSYDLIEAYVPIVQATTIQLDDNFLSWAVWEANDRFNYPKSEIALQSLFSNISQYC